jgi:hypothetical protein
MFRANIGDIYGYYRGGVDEMRGVGLTQRRKGAGRGGQSTDFDKATGITPGLPQGPGKGGRQLGVYKKPHAALSTEWSA